MTDEPVDDTCAWFRCECCEDHYCRIHGMHVFECPCPPLEQWAKAGVDPYSPGSLWDGPLSAAQFARVVGAMRRAYRLGWKRGVAFGSGDEGAAYDAGFEAGLAAQKVEEAT